MLVPALMGDMRQDEFLCEEAHAHLTECCPGFHTESNVCEQADGCGGDGSYPALTPTESNCVREKSCAELVAQGICSRAASMQARYTTTGASAGVCP